MDARSREVINEAMGFLILVAFAAVMTWMAGIDWRLFALFIALIAVFFVFVFAVAKKYREVSLDQDKLVFEAPKERSSDPNMLRLPPGASLPSSSISRILVVALRAFWISLLIFGVLASLGGWLLPAIPMLPLYVAFPLAGLLEALAQVITRRDLTRHNE